MIITLQFILFISGIVSLVAGIFMAIFLQNLVDFDKKISNKYFTPSQKPNRKEITIIQDLIVSNGKVAGIALILLGCYFLYSLSQLLFV